MNVAKGRKDFLRRAKEKGSGKPTAIVNGDLVQPKLEPMIGGALGEVRGMGTVSLHLYVKIIL